MKTLKLFIILLASVALTACFRYPAYRHLSGSNRLDLTSSTRVPSFRLCYEVESGLKVMAFESTSCPPYGSVNRITKDFCWEHDTEPLKATPSKCLENKVIIFSNKLLNCHPKVVDLTSERCVYNSFQALATLDRKSLIAGPDNVGLGWRYHMYHIACHFKNPRDYKHRANCYDIGPPLNPASNLDSPLY